MTSSLGSSVSRACFRLSKWIEPGIRLARYIHSSKQLTSLKSSPLSSFSFNSSRVIVLIDKFYPSGLIPLAESCSPFGFGARDHPRPFFTQRHSELSQYPISPFITPPCTPRFFVYLRYGGSNVRSYWLRNPLCINAADPDPLVTTESDYVLKDFRFADGESLPELKIHYRTIGQPANHPSTGEVKNAILLIHGTTGTGKEFLAKGFQEEMFEPGQPFDAAKYYLILPDAIGLGGSSKPSDGLHDRFPHTATEIWSLPKSDWSPRVSASNI
jgi:hypothetical protein